MTKLNVVKIGGHLIEKEEELYGFLEQFSLLPSPKILVHGGGKKASDLSKALGLEVEMLDGRRVTKEADLEIAVMIYAGLINKKMVSYLQGKGCDALGVSGADLNLLKATLRPKTPVDYGLVGDVAIDGVNSDRLIQLLELGIVPIFSAITHDGSGQLLNTNADTISSVLASSLVPTYDVTLSYCFEQKGVLDQHGVLIPTLTKDEFEMNKQQGIIKEGMIPKLTNAFDALNNGVKEIWIKNANALANSSGTKLIS